MIYQRGFILPNPYFLAAAGIALVVSFSLGYMKGLSNGLEQLAEYKSKVEAASAKADAANEARIRAAEQATLDVANDHAVAMGALARGYNSRLRGLQLGHSACETMSRVSESSRLPDAAAANDRPRAESLATVIDRLEADCAATTATLLYLQDWTRRVK